MEFRLWFDSSHRSQPPTGIDMDTGLHDSLLHLYKTGVRRGQLSARIDTIGKRALFFTAGWAFGVVTGLVATGWV